MEIGAYETVSLLLILTALLAVLSIVIVSWRNGISPMPSSLRVRRVVADEVNRLSGHGLIVEAGSGWGTLGLHVAKHCRGRRLVGIENSSVPLWVSKAAARLTFGAHSKPVVFQWGNIYKISYAHADLVICYLYPGAMKRLGPIFRKQLMPGASVISVCFAIPEWQPARIIACGDFYRTRIYVYKIE